MKFEEVKEDYQRLLGKYGYPSDITGGFVDAERMEKVILNPTKKNATDYMLDVISYAFQGDEFYNSEQFGEVSIYECPLLMKMYNKYIRRT